MSLETDVSNLVGTSNTLIGTVNTKLGEIQAGVDAKIVEADASIASVDARVGTFNSTDLPAMQSSVAAVAADVAPVNTIINSDFRKVQNVASQLAADAGAMYTEVMGYYMWRGGIANGGNWKFKMERIKLNDGYWWGETRFYMQITGELTAGSTIQNPYIGLFSSVSPSGTNFVSSNNYRYSARTSDNLDMSTNFQSGGVYPKRTLGLKYRIRENTNGGIFRTGWETGYTAFDSVVGDGTTWLDVHNVNVGLQMSPFFSLTWYSVPANSTGKFVIDILEPYVNLGTNTTYHPSVAEYMGLDAGHSTGNTAQGEFFYD